MSQTNTKQKKGFTMPHNYVIVFCIIVFAMLLTYIVPAGAYDRAIDPNTGRNVVVNGSFHFLDQTPVGPFRLFGCIADGFAEVADIIFFVIFAYGWINILLINGTFNSMIGGLMRKLGDKVELMIPVFMLFFGVLGSTMGMSEETYGLIPAFAGIAIALGYDAFIGTCMTYVAASTGFASATLNPFTIGVAMGISEVEYPYGLGFRIIIFLVFQTLAIVYTMRYARKIKADPTKSLLHGVPLSLSSGVATREELLATKMTGRQKLCILAFLVTVFFLVFGTIKWGWYISELSGLFIISMIVSALISGMGPNEIAKTFVISAKDMMFGAMVIGLSRGIVVVLNSGNIIDTIIYGLSTPLVTLGESLGALSQYVSALGMLVVQNIVNFFIGSGSGQASAVMPIMAPLADMIGVTRQTAVLAFQFGDGYSNLFWPSGIFLISGLMGAPADKWFRFVAPLFGMGFILQCLFMVIAVAIGF